MCTNLVEVRIEVGKISKIVVDLVTACTVMYSIIVNYPSVTIESWVVGGK